MQSSETGKKKKHKLAGKLATEKEEEENHIMTWKHDSSQRE